MGKTNSKPLISFSGKKNRLYISRDVIRLLSNPSHVCLYMTENYDSIAIGPCDETNVMSFKVPDKIYDGRKADFTITSIQFVSDVMRINHMDMDNTYRIIGQYLEDNHVVTFHFCDALIVTRERVR